METRSEHWEWSWMRRMVTCKGTYARFTAAAKPHPLSFDPPVVHPTLEERLLSWSLGLAIKRLSLERNIRKSARVDRLRAKLFTRVEHRAFVKNGAIADPKRQLGHRCPEGLGLLWCEIRGRDVDDVDMVVSCHH